MIILNPISSLFYFVCVGIDIAMFFLLVHLIMSWRHVPWLASFERIGRPLVEKIVAATGTLLPNRLGNRLSDIGRSAVGLMMLSVCKYGLGALLAMSVG